MSHHIYNNDEEVVLQPVVPPSEPCKGRNERSQAFVDNDACVITVIAPRFEENKVGEDGAVLMCAALSLFSTTFTPSCFLQVVVLYLHQRPPQGTHLTSSMPLLLQ